MTTSEEDPIRAIRNALDRLSRLASIRLLDYHDIGAELGIVEAALGRIEPRAVHVDKWFVVRRRDTEPIEVYSFDLEIDAREFYDRASLQWSECYLTAVVFP